MSTQKIIQTLMIAFLCWSGAAHANGDGNEGRNGGSINDAKLLRGKRIARSALRKFAANPPHGALTQTAKKILATYFPKNPTTKGAFQALKDLTAYSTHDELKIPRGKASILCGVDSIIYTNESELIVRSSYAEKMTEHDLAKLVLHDTGHLLGFGWEYEEPLWEVAELILTEAEKISSRGTESDQALKNAILNDDLNSVRLLVDEVDLQVFDAVTPLFAKSRVNEEIALELIQAGLELTTTGYLPYDVNRNGYGERCSFNFLHGALYVKNPRIIREILLANDQVKDIRTGNRDYNYAYDRGYNPLCGVRPLQMALFQQDAATIDAYLRALSDSDRQVRLNNELFSAIYDENVDESFALKLLELGANAKAIAQMDLATRRLEYGTSTYFYGEQPTTTLMAAIAKDRSPRLVKKLVELGANVHHLVDVSADEARHRNASRHSALSVALNFRVCNFKNAKILLDHGADTGLLNSENLSSRCFMNQTNPHRDLEGHKFALEHGADPNNYPSEYGGTLPTLLSVETPNYLLQGTQDPTLRPYWDALKEHGLNLNGHIYSEKKDFDSRHPTTVLHDLAFHIALSHPTTIEYKNLFTLIQMMIELGADPAITNSYGDNALAEFRSTRKENRTHRKWFCDIDPIERVLATGREKRFVNRRALERCGRGF